MMAIKMKERCVQTSAVLNPAVALMSVLEASWCIQTKHDRGATIEPHTND